MLVPASPRWALARTLLMSVLALTLSGSAAHAASFAVDGRTTGLFGAYGAGLVQDGFDLVEGITLGSGEQIAITAIGSVFLGTGALPSPGPDGAPGPFDRVTFGASAAAYFPLEEAFADGGGTLPSSFVDIGALFAAFVPEATAAAGGFLARNDDFGGGIASDALFLVGAGPLVFTAPEAGRLYFGINDSLGLNNTGGFTVTTTAVPEPSTALLLSMGLLAMAVRRRGLSPALRPADRTAI